MYDFGTDRGQDDLSDVVPNDKYRALFGDGPVPIADVPMANRLADTINLPGGFESWASELLGYHETFWAHGRTLADVGALRLELDEARGRAARYEAVRAAVALFDGNRQMAACALGIEPLELWRILRRDIPVKPALERAIELVQGGMSQRAASRETGVPQRTISSALAALAAA
jgi:hypothetical protein